MVNDSVSKADLLLYKNVFYGVLKDLIQTVKDELIINLSISPLDLKLKSSNNLSAKLF